jgi:hypothetical protein
MPFAMGFPMAQMLAESNEQAMVSCLESQMVS